MAVNTFGDAFEYANVDPNSTKNKYTNPAPADTSKVPAYPFLMAGQPGWPAINAGAVDQNEYPTPEGSPTAPIPPTGGGGGGGGGQPPYTPLPPTTPPEAPPATPPGPVAKKWEDVNWNPETIADYFTSRGVTPRPTSVAYWFDKWNEWGKQDPAYFLQRLSSAEEFGGADVGAGGGTPPPAPTLGGFRDPRAQALWDLLMQRASQSLNLDPRDPMIARQTDAFRAEQERGAKQTLSQLAEQGGPSANMTSEIRMGNQQVARNTSALQSQLMANELTARRTEIAGALSQMGTLLSDEQKIALQEELGLLDAALRRLQIDNQNNQFLDDLGLRAQNQQNLWDYRYRFPDSSV